MIPSQVVEIPSTNTAPTMPKKPVLDENNPYPTLEIRKWASDAEIKKAYIRMVKIYNPEIYPDQFIVIRRAYDLLRSPERRSKVDLMVFNELPGKIGYKNLERTTDSLVKLNRQIRDFSDSYGSPPPEEKVEELLQLRRERSLIYSDKKMWTEAVREWKEICGLAKNDRHSRRNQILGLSRLGYELALRERYREAIERWEEILDIYPDSVEILQNIGIAYSNLKRRNEERIYWLKTLAGWNEKLKASPDDPYLKGLIVEAHKFFGGELLNQSLPPESTKPAKPSEKPAEKKETKRKPKPAAPPPPSIFDNYSTNRDLGLACMDRKNWAGAIDAFEKCLEVRPEDAYSMGQLGWAYLNSGDVNRPFQIWKKALRIDPDNKEMKDNIFRGHLKVGENLARRRLFGPALVHLKSVLQLSRDNPQVHIEIGNIYMLKGDAYSAIQNWQKALDLDPKNKDLKTTIRRAKAKMQQM